MIWCTLVLTILLLLFFYLRKIYSYWRDRGVPGPDPIYLFGNFALVVFGNKSLNDIYGEIYRKYEGYPFVGIYRLLTPVLIIREPELVKNILVKDFKNFQANDFEVDKNLERLFGRNAFVLKGTEWKIRRAQLTNCLTSGKIKAMYPMLEEVSKRMVEYIQDRCTSGSAVLESKELCVRFTLDNVAVCALGVEGNCFTEEYSSFRKLGNDTLSPEAAYSLKSFIAFTFPFIGNIFRFKFISTDAENQFINLIKHVMEDRRKNNIVRNDFFDSISKICKSSEFNEEIDIIAQISTFLLDAYETSAVVMSFVLYNLAAHVSPQSKLREEINRYYDKSDGRLNYDTVNEMPYLQACISESMRMIPAFQQSFKVCTERYNYTCTDPEFKNLTINIEPDTSIVLPSKSLQTDPKYFQTPEKYIPERFLDKAEYNKFCFLPFGEGPRSCAGMRFAQTQMKIGVAHIIRHFELSLNNKTQIPLKFDKWYFLTCPINGLWLNFKDIGQK